MGFFFLTELMRLHGTITGCCYRTRTSHRARHAFLTFLSRMRRRKRLVMSFAIFDTIL